MKAVIFHQYGSPDVLRLAEIPTPAPKANEVLVKVRASSVNAADWHLLRADPFPVRFMMGLFKPGKINCLGGDIAGTVEAVGKDVTEFKPGDEVFGDVFDDRLGGFAEYKCARASVLAHKPVNLSFEEAATVPLAAVTASHALRGFGKVQPGEKVLINGAAGGVGTFAIQIAKALGTEVTAVCSAQNSAQARSLGADFVIDYAKEDFTRNGERHDLILGVNGYHPLGDYKRALAPGGRYAMVGGTNMQMFQAVAFGKLYSLIGGKQMGMVASRPDKAELQYVGGLIEAGKVRPVIDKRFSLSEVREAIRYVETVHARGKVVISIP